MAVTGRTRDIVASRRRRADEGEEDEAGSLDYDSQSEASALSAVNDSPEEAASDISGVQKQGTRTHNSRGSPHKQRKNRVKSAKAASPQEPQMQSNGPVFTSTAEVHAMVNGLSPPNEANGADTMQFEDDFPADSQNNIHGQNATRKQPSAQVKGARLPPKVMTTAAPDAQRTTRRRGRESSGLAYSANPLPGGASSAGERWTHDLHDLLESDTANKQGLPIVEDIPRRNLPTYCTSAKGPEPLSRTVTIGHITLKVSLPGMSQSIPYEKTPLRYHIRLPDLRPPLRRDKPVRVSLPYHPPRYIFPSVDRSFIFIPRAQRPNQQGGRRPFGSRRNSVFGGSSYSPSIAMSRRSSMARDGLVSPAASGMGKAPFGAPTGPSRPVVKLPAGARAHVPMSNGYGYPQPLMTAPIDGVSEPMYPPPGKPALQSQWTGQIPVHQPRPQKTVSVTNLEAPPKERLHAPQQHEHQPFHHQVPNMMNGMYNTVDQPSTHSQYVSNPYTGNQASGTPAHLPNTAVNAQPFQPDQSTMYYPPAYNMQDMMYYPPAENATASYIPPQMMAQPVYMPHTVHGSYLVPMLGPAPVTTMAPVPEAPPGTNSYEQNGTVFFQYGADANMNGGGYDTSGANGAAKPTGGEMLYPTAPMNYYPQQQ